MRGWRALRIVGLGVVAAALLTSCIKLDVDLKVQSDDTIDGAFTVGISKQLIAFVPDGAGGLGGLLGDSEPDFGSAEATVTPYEDDRFVGQTVTFTGVPLEEASSGLGDATSGDLTIDKEGDTYRLQGTLDLTQDDADLPTDIPIPNLDQFFAEAEVRIRVSFPGRVIESNGSVDGCTVTWEPTFGQEVDLDAVARTSGGCGGGIQWWGWLLIGLGGAVVIGAIVAIVLSIRYERRRHRAPPAAGTTTGGEPPAGAFPPPQATAAGSVLVPPDGPPVVLDPPPAPAPALPDAPAVPDAPAPTEPTPPTAPPTAPNGSSEA